MTRPTFSICIPNFNYGRYIGKTIQSVLNQTYQEFEIVVADNASTDDSVEVVNSFKDERIRLVRNRYNIGFAPNLQRVTQFARHEFVNLLSSDDLMKPDALRTYADVLCAQGERAAQTVLYSDAELVDGQGRVTGLKRQSPESFAFDLEEAVSDSAPPETELRWQRYSGKEILSRTLRQIRAFAPFLTIVYPRALWEAVEGYNSVRTIGPDKHFGYKLLALDPDVVYVKRPLFQWRVHGSANFQSFNTSIKQQIDDYLYTVETPDALLAELGLQRRELIHALLDRVCLKNGLKVLGQGGSYSQAFKMLAFSFAAYPGATLTRPRTYALAGLLALGPLARPVARLCYRFYRQPLRTAAEGTAAPSYARNVP